MNRYLSTVALGVLVFATGARAQTISTDRPGLGFSPATVPAGVIQFELGTPSLGFPGSSGDPDVALDAAVRAGLFPHVELRASTQYAARTAGGDGPTGIAGVRAGFKIGVPTGGPLSFALIPEVVLPVGDADLVPDRAAWSLVAAAGIPVGELGLTVVGGAERDPVGATDHATNGLLALVLGGALARDLSGFVEGALMPGPGDDAAYAGAGATWLLTPRLQLDAFLDVGVNDAASDALTGVGISYLIP